MRGLHISQPLHAKAYWPCATCLGAPETACSCCPSHPVQLRFPIARISKCQLRDRDNTWYYEVVIDKATKQLWYRHGAFFVCVPEGGILHGGEPPSMDRYELRKRYGFNA